MAWVVLANLRGPAGTTAYYKGGTPLTDSADFDTIPAGLYTISSNAVSTALGLPRPKAGSVTVTPVGSTTARTLSFQSLEGNGLPDRLFIMGKIGDTWSSWTEVSTSPFLYANRLEESTILYDLPDGNHLVYNVITARALGLPRERPGIFTTFRIGNGRIYTFVSIEDGEQPAVESRKQITLDGTHQPWYTVGGSGGGSGVVANSSGPVRRDLLQQQLTARKGGKIGTNGKGVIALRFDDAPEDFVSKVLPLLKARNLPFTRVSTSKSIHDETIPASTFPVMEDYCIKSGGEVWNHGATHRDASGAGAIFTEFIGALNDLRSWMPRIPIDCFAPPGGSVSYDGHMPSNEVSNWADTYAGRLLMDYHAVASGYFQDSYYKPIDGVLRDGQIHYSVDSYDTARGKELVDRARDWKKGVVMMWHSNNIGTSGNMTLASFIAVLDYIVAQRDAGNILVLTKSGLGVADVSSSYRDDALTTHSGSSFSEVFAFPQYRQNLPGSTRELTATVTGSVGATVTSKIGESTKTHTIPAGGTLNLRHVATIPLDATALTVSINANTSNAKLLAV
ncbi:polysaccharide deacetylase family protein [Glutamicibacter ardleyensis]|uniref:polysaccharide deacetylase family protein n=1 Tax=Glutamicibacter ardleyensis TaxID=225894 RepID=UPI003FD3759F